MSLVRRIWNALRNPVRHVGRDLDGNTYFESRSYNDPSRTKRTVQYSDPDDMWKYIATGKRLPVQWSAWLTHTRLHPPTLEELEADLDRQRRILFNASMIEARDKAEAEEMKRVRQQEAHIAIEDAVNTRTERSRLETGLNDEPTAPGPTSEAQETPLNVSQVLPPRFVTPPTARKGRPSKSFPMSSPAESPAPASEIQSSSGNASPWKMASTETESWTPKLRKRG